MSGISGISARPVAPPVPPAPLQTPKSDGNDKTPIQQAEPSAQATRDQPDTVPKPGRVISLLV